MPAITADGTVPSRPMPVVDAGRPAWMGLCAIGVIILSLWLTPTGPHAAIKALAQFFSVIGNIAFLVVGYGALLLINWQKRAWVSIRVILTTLIVVTIVIHLQKFCFGAWLTRPTGNLGGFPSGHAAAACALAFLLAVYFPRFAVYGYGMAVAISWSRIPVAAHWPYQVVAGSITGFLLALLITDRIARYAYQHRIAQVWQSIIISLIPLAAVCYTQYEYENDRVVMIGAMVSIICGMTLRLLQYRRRADAAGPDTAMIERRQHRMRHLANTLICAGVTFGAEVVWLVPLELLICLVVYTLDKRAYHAESTGDPVDRTSGPTPTLLPPTFSLITRFSWVGEFAWLSLALLVVIKELRY